MWHITPLKSMKAKFSLQFIVFIQTASQATLHVFWEKKVSVYRDINFYILTT